MSGYFGALMRSSGMAIADRAPAPAPVEPSAAASDVERSPAAMRSPTVQTASTSQPAAPPAPVGNGVERLVPRPPATDIGTREARAGTADAETARQSSAADLAADSPAAPPARAVEPSKPAFAHPLVRAALQWVAADPQQVRSGAEVMPPRRRPPPAHGEEASPITMTQVVRDRGAAMQAQPTSAVLAPPAAPELAPPDTVAARASPTRSAAAAPAPPPLPIAPSVREEVVEISIGAIHVRVDAPAAPTVARPAAPPPALAPRVTPPIPARSALSRRALRRI